jgi:hypothetical protein
VKLEKNKTIERRISNFKKVKNKDISINLVISISLKYKTPKNTKA